MDIHTIRLNRLISNHNHICIQYHTIHTNKQSWLYTKLAHKLVDIVYWITHLKKFYGDILGF